MRRTLGSRVLASSFLPVMPRQLRCSQRDDSFPEWAEAGATAELRTDGGGMGRIVLGATQTKLTADL